MVQHGTLAWAIEVTRDALGEQYPGEYVDIDALQILVDHAEQNIRPRGPAVWAVLVVLVVAGERPVWSQVWVGGTEADAEAYRKDYIERSAWRTVPHTDLSVIVRPVDEPDLPAIPGDWAEQVRQSWRSGRWEKTPAT